MLTADYDSNGVPSSYIGFFILKDLILAFFKVKFKIKKTYK